MLIGNPDSICKSLQKEQNSRITFSYNGEVYPAQGKALELVPFFRLHNSRYAVYFRQASEEQFKAIQEEMATAERKATELANQTIDLIFPGEQQPESDRAAGVSLRDNDVMRPNHPGTTTAGSHCTSQGFAAEAYAMRPFATAIRSRYPP